MPPRAKSGQELSHTPAQAAEQTPAASPGPAGGASGGSAEAVVAGQTVEYLQDNGKWRPAVVLEVGQDGLLRIRMLTNDSVLTGVPASRWKKV